MTMTPPPDGTPWWAWLLGVVVAVGIPALTGLLLAQHKQVKAITVQVKNTHATNMREDIDKTHAVAAKAATDAKLAAESSHRTERLVEDLVKSIRAGEHSADRRDKISGEALQEVREDLKAHLDEVPQILEDAFNRHAADCPRRTLATSSATSHTA